MHRSRPPRNQRGLTLIELMITIVIASVLLAIAAPAFQQVVESNRLRTETNKLLTGLNLARSEAVKRNTDVTLCPGTSDTACDGDLKDGWVISMEPNDPNELVREFDGLGNDYAITGTDGTTVTGAVVFSPDGSIPAAVTWMICPPDRDVDFARAVRVNVVGRPAVTNAEAGWKCEP